MNSHVRRGFTIVEVLIAAVISCIALAGVFYLFRQSRQSVASSEERIGVLQQGRLLLEYLKRDLRRVRPPEGNAEAIEVADGRIAFSVLLDDGGAEERTDRIRYTFDRGGQRVIRESEEQGEKTFGGEAVRIRDFGVREETRRIGSQDCVAFVIALDLADAANEPRNRMRLDESVFPPLLQKKHGLVWVD